MSVTKVWVDASSGDDAETCIIFKSGVLLKQKIGSASATQAKFKAVIQALEILGSEKHKKILIYTDCNYLVELFAKKWHAKSNSHKRLFNKAQHLKRKLNCDIVFMPTTTLRTYFAN